MGSVNDYLRDVSIPAMVRVRQVFQDKHLADPISVLRKELLRPAVCAQIAPGMSVAIAAGSRGLDCYVPILRELVTWLFAQGARPFIVPAMGSHGGATSEGQAALLASYGISEATVGAPIHSSMEVAQVGRTPDGEPAWMDKLACQADGIILFNRIKPHTGFRGDVESGLVKMAAIGLGKQKGAEAVHAGGPKAMAQRVMTFGTAVIKNAKILFGVGTIEDAYDRVAQLRVLLPDEILSQEPLLLRGAKTLLPKIMFERLDVLVVDQIGKNISGPGMDPNITHTYLPDADIPDELREKRAHRVVVLGLTDETHGAAMGIGMADMTTQRLFEKMDFNATYYNCLTTAVTSSAKMPMFFENDRLAIQAAIRSLGDASDRGIRMVRIRDTLHLGEVWISKALLPEAQAMLEVQALEELLPLPFNKTGNLF